MIIERETFALAALPPIMAISLPGVIGLPQRKDYELWADMAYEMADAMARRASRAPMGVHPTATTLRRGGRPRKLSGAKPPGAGDNKIRP